MVLIQRSGYVDLVQGGVIDVAISPQQATISALLTHVRRADIVNVSSLRRGAAEAIEAIAHGDESTSKVVGRAVGDIKLPPGTTIGAIVRGEEVLIAMTALSSSKTITSSCSWSIKNMCPTWKRYSSRAHSSCKGWRYAQLTPNYVYHRASAV